MAAVARPVLEFLNSFYPSDPAEKQPARDFVNNLEAADLKGIVAGTRQDFPSSLPRKKGGKKRMSVQFDANTADIERVRKRIRKPNLSAGAIGRYTFEHFLKTECS
jgi:hypothetical protein